MSEFVAGPSSPLTLRPFAAFAVVFGVLGAAVGVQLTKDKFRHVSFRCNDESGCALGGTSDYWACGKSLASTWSEVLTLPVSLWATGFYAVVVAAAVVVLLRPRRAGTAPHLLLSLACANVAVTLVMATYSLLALKGLCPLCSILYLLSGLLLAVTIPLYRRVRAVGGAPWRSLWSRPGALLDAWFFAGTVFVSVTGVQAVVYQVERGTADPNEGCPKATPPLLPDTSLKLGSRDPQAVLAVFVDPTCVYCKQVHEHLTALYKEFPRVQVRFYHFPRYACDTQSFQSGFPGTHEQSRQQGACLAAMAVECAERLSPGTGTSTVLLTSLFLHQDDKPDDKPLFTMEKILRSAQWLRDVGTHLPPNQAMVDCINSGDAAARIAEHQHYLINLREGAKLGLPVLMMFPVRQGAIELSAVQYLSSELSKGELSRYLENAELGNLAGRGS